jgi:hypothetical protein
MCVCVYACVCVHVCVRIQTSSLLRCLANQLEIIPSTCKVRRRDIFRMGLNLHKYSKVSTLGWVLVEHTLEETLFGTYSVFYPLICAWNKSHMRPMMMILLLFLQKQNLAFAVYLFGSVLSLPD